MDHFGSDFAGRLALKLQRPVNQVTGDDSLAISGKDGTATRVSLGSFRAMHRHGETVENLVERVSRVAEYAYGKPDLSWGTIQSHVILHLVPETLTFHGVVDSEASLCGTRVVLAVDYPEFLTYLDRDHMAELERAGIDRATVVSTAQANLSGALLKHPPDELAPGVFGFHGDLAADRAYMHAISVPNAVMLPLSADLALTATALEAVNAFAKIPKIASDTAPVHRFDPYVQIFSEGRFVGTFAPTSE